MFTTDIWYDHSPWGGVNVQADTPAGADLLARVLGGEWEVGREYMITRESFLRLQEAGEAEGLDIDSV